MTHIGHFDDEPSDMDPKHRELCFFQGVYKAYETWDKLIQAKGDAMFGVHACAVPLESPHHLMLYLASSGSNELRRYVNWERPRGAKAMADSCLAELLLLCICSLSCAG